MSASFHKQSRLNDKTADKMKCSQIDKMLFNYAEGTLSSEDSVVVEGHLNECTYCRGFVEEIRKVLSVVETEKRVEENPFFFTRVEARMLRHDRVPELSLVRLLPTLAAVIFFVGGVFAGINIGKLYGTGGTEDNRLVYETKQYIDDFGQEPIESYIINFYPEGDDKK